MPRYHCVPSAPRPLGCLALFGAFVLLLFKLHPTHAEISSADAVDPLRNNLAPNRRCSVRKFMAISSSNDDIEDLELDVPVNIALDNRQRKRFLLFLNYSTPLSINFSQNAVRKIYFNETTNLSRALRSDQREVLFPCALRGQYDVFLQAKRRGSMKVEAHAGHPRAGWPLLNRTSRSTVRTQNRVRRRQMIVKWDKSKFDIHAVHYCLVVDAKRPHGDFCAAVDDYIVGATRRGGSCLSASVADFVWLKPPERAKKIDPRITNVVCTGRRTQQLLKGVAANATYFLDVFGVHTQRQNLTFHLASTRVPFDRTHPVALRENSLRVEKLTGLSGVQVFSFKIPTAVAAAADDDHQRPPQQQQQQQEQQPSQPLQLRYLVLPCGGSEVDIKILKRRKAVGSVSNIYRPTYIRLPAVAAGERYIMRVAPSNEDEVLRANKVGLAVTTDKRFAHLPELPENITVFEVRSRCKSTTIAWHRSPDERTTSYCVIVFSLPHRSRGFTDYTNYCMLFVKQFMRNPLFYSIDCMERSDSSAAIETHTILNLSPGEGYLIYVTANLSEGRVLPYQTLRVQMSQNCYNELYDSREQTSYY